MYKIILSFSIIIILNSSCTRNEVRHLTGKDTTGILNITFNGKTLIKELLPYTDTLYLIKNKYFNKTWHPESDYFRFIFINNTPQVKIVNFGPNSPSDARTRIEILKFNLQNDTVQVLLIDHGVQLYFDTHLKLDHGQWKIIEQKVNVGGKRKHYDFENEKWYLNQKKEMKNRRQEEIISFPPSKPKD